MAGILSAFAVLLAGFAISGLWWWFGFTLALLALLGVVELLAIKYTGMTISQQYTQMARKNPLIGMILHTIIGGFFGFLLYHLATGY